MKVAGQSVPRVDGPAKVTGRARYALDLTVPGMTHGAVARSDRAHARILSVDTGEAEAVNGVLEVITGASLAPLDLRFGHVVRDHPALAVDRVLYHGEPVALVVAETRRAAERAARLVSVDYEDLPAVMDADEALGEGAPVLHPERIERTKDEGLDQGGEALVGNLCAAADFGWGDVDAALAAADLVLEGEYRYPMLYGYAMEPYNAIASFEEGSLVVYSTAQHPYMVREDLARIFALPLARVRVVVPYVGGGYGSKSYTKVEPLAALGAYVTGRPVRVALSVEESILTTRSDGARVRARSAFAADGTLLARDFDVVMDSGAYTDNSPVVCAKLANRCFGPYRIGAVRVRVRSAFTNTVPASSLRGFGAPQGNLAGELQMDDAADRLGIDALALRLKNVVRPGEEILPGKRGIDADLPADLDLLTTSLGWPNAPEGRGIGFGISASDAGAHPTSVAMVRLHADGSASAAVGATELGQGSRTVLSQILAEQLGLPMEKVAIVAADTGVTPYERTTGASRTTALVGRSLMAACADAKRRVAELAGEGAEFADAIKAFFGAGGEIIGVGAVRRHGEFRKMPPFWEIGCSGVVAAVDAETGRVRVEQLSTVGDVGFAINPALVHGQDLGAATMGLGAALSEQLVYDGQTLANPNVVDYRVPRCSDIPERLDQILAQRQDGIGPYGAKGAGEGTLNPVGAAVAAAVGRIVGRYPRELPLTPERVWRLAQTEDARV
ncbi:xanthine dehydrogenase family protein molybdopterin-binding subunit [Solirubrobacter sp. CPCC 204708]|uniref:Xanthine dehydrogenase family protein molybdopterin-binding subunit n=1 Tax=Solirubrobacter deserti TaxID=2282478 RepID=A0ABT4RFD6_9ACTN|nr:xanthine dehydrogenase family protein molybdopterin-binding subunit [Solirubrobacter deserti]MBE2319479.1 xanthine dehydrogenase family protein molybdopterin-binding subunit [Solirubrobacter deserti]MDA0137234.1 xanthine dehydrogenase family protein molybdopterin-binding subunit [Solirubrobacter deserti]